jgi:hypothetical protein
VNIRGHDIGLLQGPKASSPSVFPIDDSKGIFG